ncbi:MAG: hypothetical protein IJU19_08760 [Bacteroidales bacterium]|nr:hypothetical protein [Bacteroidales bacterium]
MKSQVHFLALLMLLFATAPCFAQHKDIKAMAAELQRKEKSHYDEACKANTEAAYNRFLTTYPNGNYSADIRQRLATLNAQREQACFDSVIQLGTEQAFRTYLRQYPKGTHSTVIQHRLDDLSAWLTAKHLNTIDGYQHYLNTSRYQVYATQARAALEEIKSSERWRQIRYTSSQSDLEDFIVLYPNSSHFTAAKQRLYELQAVDYFYQGDSARAYSYFLAAGGSRNISLGHIAIYNACAGYNSFKKLNSRSPESDLYAFLNTYPNSRYHDQVSNMLACRKARCLPQGNNEFSYDVAMSYAKDNATKAFVNHCRDSVAKAYKSSQRNTRHRNHNLNGNYLQFGFEFFDFGLPSSNLTDDGIYYQLGVSLKLGNYAAPVQFEIGMKGGMYKYEIASNKTYSSYYSYSYYDESTSETAYNFPVYSRLKLNLFSFVTDDCKCYVDATGYLNNFSDICNKDYSYSFGFGFAAKHFDISLYFGNINAFGTSMRVYF